MVHWWLVYGFLTGLTIYIARRWRSEDTLGAAYVLAGLWITSNLSHWFIPHPYNQFFPALDGFTAFLMALVWRKKPRVWTTVLIGLLLADCCVHAERFQHGDTHARRFRYDLSLNLIYGLQLTTVCAPGLIARFRISRTPLGDWARRLAR